MTKEIILKYKITGEYTKLFDEKFINNNKSCKMIINGNKKDKKKIEEYYYHE